MDLRRKILCSRRLFYIKEIPGKPLIFNENQVFRGFLKNGDGGIRTLVPGLTPTNTFRVCRVTASSLRLQFHYKYAKVFAPLQENSAFLIIHVLAKLVNCFSPNYSLSGNISVTVHGRLTAKFKKNLYRPHKAYIFMSTFLFIYIGFLCYK